MAAGCILWLSERTIFYGFNFEGKVIFSNFALTFAHVA